MTLAIVSVLQIGDVHFPGEQENSTQSDVKDDSFPEGLLTYVASSRLWKVVRRIQETIDTGQPPHAIFVGDITTGANTAAYGQALDYFHRAFVEGRKFYSTNSFMQIIPGNHDITRNKTFSLSLTDKFAAFKKMIDDRNLPPLPIDAVRVVKVPVDGFSGVNIHLILVNSCYGCGEQRHLPEKIRASVVKAYQVAAEEAEKDPIDPQAKLAEVLFQTAQPMDTPLISELDLAFVDSYIRQMPDHDVPIVCAHHNFLPQFRPRIDTYTELLNAGNLRRTLLELERPVLFLHGHIHDDPIDVITDPKRPKSLVISISAPLLHEGFNSIAIAFNANQIPIGCRVEEIRISDSGRTFVNPIVIPFWTSAVLLSVISADAHALFSAMDRTKTYRLLELPTLLNDNSPVDLGKIKDMVLELDWLKLVEVKLISAASDYWHVRRFI